MNNFRPVSLLENNKIDGNNSNSKFDFQAVDSKNDNVAITVSTSSAVKCCVVLSTTITITTSLILCSLTALPLAARAEDAARLPAHSEDPTTGDQMRHCWGTLCLWRHSCADSTGLHIENQQAHGLARINIFLGLRMLLLCPQQSLLVCLDGALHCHGQALPD